MNQRNKFIAEEICNALERGNVPNLDDVDKTLDHLTSRNGALIAPLAHHQRDAMEHQERRVNSNLRRLLVIGSLLAEHVRQFNEVPEGAATGWRDANLAKSLSEAWEKQLLKFCADHINRKRICRDHH